MKYKISTILILTAIAAFGTVYGLSRYRKQQEEVRQQTARATFASVASAFSSLDGPIREKLVALPSVQTNLRASYPIKEDEDVHPSFLAGGYGGEAEAGEIIATPKFRYTYEYSWGPLDRVANEDEKFYVEIQSQLDPAQKQKPVLRITARDNKVVQDVVEWVVGQVDQDQMEIVRQAYVEKQKNY